MKNIRRNRAATALVLAALVLVTALVMKLPDWYEAWKAPARTIGEVTQLDESLLRTANTKQILTLLEDPDTQWVNLSAQTDTQAARDAAWLEQHGYHAEKVQPVDLFPRTKHVEAIVSLQREI